MNTATYQDGTVGTTLLSRVACAMSSTVSPITGARSRWCHGSAITVRWRTTCRSHRSSRMDALTKALTLSLPTWTASIPSVRHPARRRPVVCRALVRHECGNDRAHETTLIMLFLLVPRGSRTSRRTQTHCRYRRARCSQAKARRTGGRSPGRTCRDGKTPRTRRGMPMTSAPRRKVLVLTRCTASPTMARTTASRAMSRALLVLRQFDDRAVQRRKGDDGPRRSDP